MQAALSDSRVSDELSAVWRLEGPGVRAEAAGLQEEAGGSSDGGIGGVFLPFFQREHPLRELGHAVTWMRMSDDCRTNLQEVWRKFCPLDIHTG